jgi:hypothetical protein
MEAAGEYYTGRVKVYWNFNRRCWSVQHARTGLVLRHQSELCLALAGLSVSEAGRQRVLRERRKNVHAKIAGLPASVPIFSPACTTRIRYNPYRDESFVTEAGDRVDAADAVHFRSDGTVWADSPRANGVPAACMTPQSRKILVS